MNNGKVISLSKSTSHSFTKYNCSKINLIKGIGIEGDIHSGKTVKHRSRVIRDPNQPNLRQVHLIHKELFDELAEKGFSITPGLLGENITTEGIDLLSLPKGTILQIGKNVEIEITGLRNPCHQINEIQSGLMQALLDKDSDGNLIRKAGVMAIVLTSGTIKTKDEISCTLPPKPHVKLEKV